MIARCPTCDSTNPEIHRLSNAFASPSEYPDDKLCPDPYHTAVTQEDAEARCPGCGQTVPDDVRDAILKGTWVEGGHPLPAESDPPAPDHSSEVVTLWRYVGDTGIRSRWEVLQPGQRIDANGVQTEVRTFLPETICRGAEEERDALVERMNGWLVRLNPRQEVDPGPDLPERIITAAESAERERDVMRDLLYGNTETGLDKHGMKAVVPENEELRRVLDEAVERLTHIYEVEFNGIPKGDAWALVGSLRDHLRERSNR